MQSVTNRDRVVAAINFQKTDYVPYTVGFTVQAREKLRAFKGRAYVDAINSHLTGVELVAPEAEVKPGFFRDEYGVVWNRTGADKDIGMPERKLIPDADALTAYEFPPVNEKLVRSACAWLEAQPVTQFRGVGIGFSLFERLWTLMGMENALCNMLLEPTLVHALMKKICERNLAMLKIALTYDFDYVYFGDDWGQQNGLIMGLPHWNEFIRPYLAKMYAAVKNAGRYIAQHSCGDIRSILDDLSTLGLDIYQTFQPEIYGLDYAEKLRGKITVWGGISTQRDLPYKTPGEVREITRETLSKFKGHGGLIAAPTHAIPGDVPAENMAAMIEVLANQ